MQNEYKQICGIYKITNIINFKPYVGQSVDIQDRWHQHKYNNTKDSAIHKAIKKYGIKNFIFEILEECPREQLNEREKYWIAYYDSFYNGYNETLGGDGYLTQCYEDILNLWNKGNNCKAIAKLIPCNVDTVTKALHYYNITEEEIRSRSNYFQGKPIVAIDIITNKPLKIFSNSAEINDFFNNIYKAISLNKHITNRYRYKGYYWEYLNDNNIPEKELTNEEFLSYQQEKLYVRSPELIEQISQVQRKVERCSREELKKLLRTIPILQIGHKFNVSDNTIRKWCDFYKLPRRVKDIKQYSNEEWEKL